MRVLVIGSKGQLGQSLKSIALNYAIDFIFSDRSVLDITNQKNIKLYFKNNEFDYCVNCSAYTAVDKAEEELELATKINVLGVSYLAEACKNSKTELIHISTDFVFQGNSFKPYKESDVTKPISVYGKTKLEGEKIIKKTLENHYIIRTSWLYSEFGNNFMKSMLNLSKTRKELSIINDQIGTPTYALDLAEVIIKIIEIKPLYGIYNYSNEGVATWYDFAKTIFEYAEQTVKTNPIPTTEYPTPAMRPVFSVLDKSKIKNNLQIEIPYWRDSLKNAIKNYNE
ncbi:dTDP-4-dehydrorhamnose reductase [Aurantibacter sp.]|uniref:dTDP-4-dehydrorhamnose reductase n=1 Tax=Aurantibacter sp. TaxID=2807103 RepID=UPI0035C7A71F